MKKKQKKDPFQDSIICATSPKQLDVLIEKWFWASILISQWRSIGEHKPKYLYLYAPKRYYFDDKWWKLIEKFIITEIYPIPEKAYDEWKSIIFVDSNSRESIHIPHQRVQGRIYWYSSNLDSRKTDL